MFERLTAPSEVMNGMTIKALCESCGEDACGDLCTEYLYKECKGCPVQEAFDRLAAYEDSGLSPEEVRELAKARNLIGKTVYCVFAGVKKVMKRKIHGFEVSSNRIVLLAENGKKDYYLAEISAVGKTIFLTREEAEKALGGVARMKLIDADELYDCISDNFYGMELITLKDVLEIIELASTIDVMEVGE